MEDPLAKYRTGPQGAADPPRPTGDADDPLAKYRGRVAPAMPTGEPPEDDPLAKYRPTPEEEDEALGWKILDVALYVPKKVLGAIGYVAQLPGPHQAFLALDVFRRGAATAAGKVGSEMMDPTGLQAAGLAGPTPFRRLMEAGLDIPEGAEQAPAATWAEEWRTARTGESQLVRAGILPGEGAGWEVAAGVAYDIWTDPLNLMGFAGGLTEAGRAAQKAGTLATTWAAQTAKGHRVALRVITPTREMGKLQFFKPVIGAAAKAKAGLKPAFAWTSVVKGEKAVGAIGDFGNATKYGLARLFGYTATKSKAAYRSGLAGLKAAQEISQNKNIEPIMRIMRLKEGFAHLVKDLPQDLAEQVWRAAEQAGRPGWRQAAFAAYDPRVQERALHALIYAAELRKVADEAGLILRPLGGELRKVLDDFGRMKKGELKHIQLAFLKQQVKMGGKQRDLFNDILRLRQESAGAATQAGELTKPFRRVVTAQRLAKHEQKVGRQAGRALAQLDTIRQDHFNAAARKLKGIKPGTQEAAAQVSEWYARSEPGMGIEAVTDALRKHEPVTTEMLHRLRPHLSKQQYADLSAELKKLGKLEEGRRIIGQTAKREVLREKNRLRRIAQKADAKARATQDHLSNLYETQEHWRVAGPQDTPWLRQIEKAEVAAQAAQDTMPNWVPHTMDRAGLRHVLKLKGKDVATAAWSQLGEFKVERHFHEAMLVGDGMLEKAVKVPASFDEIEKMLAKPAKYGAAVEAHAEFAKGGIMEGIGRIFGKERKAQLRRLYELDPTKSFNRVADRMAHTIRSRDFILSIMDNPELVARAARPGPEWVPLRWVSSRLADEVGEVFVHPAVSRELRRVYTNLFQPESAQAALRAFDGFTRLFKKTVTTPESVFSGMFIGLGKMAERRQMYRLGKGLKATGKVVGWLPGYVAYHFRNAYSDFTLMAYNGKFDGAGVMKNGTLALGNKGKIACGPLGELTPRRVRNMAQAYGVTFGQTLELGGGASRVGTQLEDMRRLGYFVDGLQQGFTPYQASLRSKKVLFDYGDMSRVERELFRRVIPFWAWLRNNVRLQVQQVVDWPAIQMMQHRLAGKAVSDAPAWIRGRGAANLGTDPQTGEEKLLVGLDFPVQDITELLDAEGGFQGWVKNVAFRINPGLKIMGSIYGIVTGPSGERPKSTTRSVAAIIKAAGMEDVVGLRKHKGRDGEVYYTMKQEYEQLFRYVLNRFYTTEKRMAGPWLTTKQKWQSYLTGTTIQRFSPTKERRKQKEADRQRELIEALSTGDVRMFKQPWAPRGSPLSKEEVRRLRR